MPHELPSRTGSEKREESETGRSELPEVTAPSDASLEEPTTSQLRGKLLEQTKSRERSDAQELSKLRGTLLEKQAGEVEPYSPEWLKMQTFVQRDSGKLFVVEDIIDSRHGERIKLKCLTAQQTVTLSVDNFVERLQIPGEAWSVENA